MKRLLRITAAAAAVVLLVAAIGLLAGALYVRAHDSGGKRLADRTSAPLILPSATEVVADLDYPPGDIAVSASGRIFFTYHPQGSPPVQLNELIGVMPQPWPDEAFQASDFWTRAPHFQSVLAVRIDRQDRLWVLDYAHFGVGQPRLLAFDIGTKEIVHQYDFPSAVAGFLSMLNDFQVSPDGTKIYITDASPIRQTPALVVYDTVTGLSRRVLERHASVRAEDYVIQAPMRDMTFFGIYTLKIGVDSIALDQHGEWLYYGPLSGDRLYRIATAALNDASLSAAELAAKVEDYGPKTLSAGLSTDEIGNVYITDIEHSAILTLAPDRQLKTLVKDSPFRWPAGLSFAPEGWLYVTCSDLHQVLFENTASVRSHAPFQIIRFKPGPLGVPGH